ncbi:MAG: hypothetical protein K2I56_02450 [Muribaculaceae bacterium]|nr:hypothetical protein [Muribaculaceae bacterium]
MKSIKLAAALTLFAALASNAQEADYRYGFCDNTKGLDSRMLTTNAGSIEAAIYLTPEDMGRFSNASITGVNVGVQQNFNIASIETWVRSSLDGENLASQMITSSTTPALAVGWLGPKFDEPFKTADGEGYYIGYTMTLKNPGMMLLFADRDLRHAGGCWLKFGSGEWTDESQQYGVLNLEALIYGDNLPQNDIELTSASYASKYVINNTPLEVDYSVHNAGMKTVNSYTLVLEDADNGVSRSQTVNCELKHDQREQFTAGFTFEGLETEKEYTFTLRIESPNGIADETPANNEIELPGITSILNTYLRTVLVEEFTTERCSNCPSAAANLHAALVSLRDSERARVAAVCHHAGYGEDSFTLPCDRDYLFFYGGPTLFAPGFMIDRVPGNNQTGYNPVSGPMSSTTLKSKFLEHMDTEAFYSIEVYGEHDPVARTIKLDINGKCAVPVLDNPRVTVYLVEDDVPAVYQSGGGTNFKHSHLVRAYNETWGQPPVWSDAYTYSVETKLSYSENCKPENMEIVAVISNFDASSCNNCEVGNAAKVKLSDLYGKTSVAVVGEANADVRVVVSGRDIVVNGEYESVAVYDLSGRASGMTNLTAGIYVVNVTTANGPVQARVLVK